MVNITPMREQVRFVTIAPSAEAKAAGAVASGQDELPGLNSVNGIILSPAGAASAETVEGLAKAYDHRPAAVEQEPVVYVIDQTGQLRAHFQGLKFEPTSLVGYVNALVDDDHSQSTRR